MALPLRWRLVLPILKVLPQRLLSSAFGWVADRPVPRRLRRPLLGPLANLLGIDLTEAERPLDAYPSFGALFVRRLRAGLRPLPEDPSVVVSPVDGVAGTRGVIEEGLAIQAKGVAYSVDELLGGEGEGDRFRGGSFLTLYLSPRHYHRIHAPAAGMVVRARHLPGVLLPVNRPAVASIPRLFPGNERLVAWLDTQRGPIGVVAVGAFNVGRISAAFDPEWNREGGPPGVTNRRGRRSPELRDYDPAPAVAVGEELMAFHLGSTVVLLLPAGCVLDAPGPDAEVRMGEGVARWQVREGDTVPAREGHPDRR